MSQKSKSTIIDINNNQFFEKIEIENVVDNIDTMTTPMHKQSMKQTNQLKKIDLEKTNVDSSNMLKQKEPSISTINKKIDLKNKCNNINNTTMNANCKTTTNHFGTTMWFNTATSVVAKALKKINKYSSPMQMAINDAKDIEDEICIKYDEEGRGAKTWTKYGHLTIDELEKYAWKVNNNLFEIVPKGRPFKLYFDIDARYLDEKTNKEMLDCVKVVVKDILKIDMKDKDLAICFGKGVKDDYIKVSWHIVVNNGIYFKDMDDCKIAMKNLNHAIITNDKYDVLRNGVLDFNVYKDNQAFKLPYQSKAFKKIIQKPQKITSKFTDFVLTYQMSCDMEYYDISKLADVDTRSKVIKTASGKAMKLDFDMSIQLKQYQECFGKNYKIGIVEGKKSDGLSYYLNSIPNNEKVSRGIWKIVGWCISKITKNSDEGLVLWAKWTKPYGIKCQVDDLREDYFSHTTTKGYGWSTLYSMARIFNKRIENDGSVFDVLFDDTPTFECEKEIINSRYNGEVIDIKKILNDNDICAIKAPMGCGKSWDLKKVFDQKKGKELKYQSICYLSCKRAFASSMINDFRKFGFVNYLDVEYKEEISKEDRIICSVESIHYCRDKYDIVIIDESESICDNLMGEMYMKNKPISCSLMIKDMIINSPKIMIMDAYLTSRSFDMVKDILGEKILTKKAHYLVNEFQYPQRNYHDLDKELFVYALIDKLKEGKRCAVVCGSKKLSEYIREQLVDEDINIKFYDNRNPLPITCNVNKEWEDAQLLMYTPTITAGISYDPQLNGKKDVSKHYDNLFVYCVNKGSCHFRDTIQAHKRVRDFKSNEVYICINDKFKGHPTDIMPTTKEGVREMEDKYKSSLFSKENNETINLKNTDDLEWIYNVNIHNKLERNISQLMLRGFAKTYLSKENIIQISSDEGENPIVMNDEHWDFDDIEDITPIEAEETKRKLACMRMDKPKVEDDEIQEYVKFNYDNLHIVDEIDDDVKKKFFNKYFSDGKDRKKLGSVRSFKQMLYDIEYQFTELASWVKNKREQRNEVIEMFDMKYMRYNHLMNFFHHLGFIKDDKLDIDTIFSGEDFKKLEHIYSNIDVKALNSMMNDGYIRIKKKDESVKTLNTKQIKGIFNQLLKDEFGMECYGNGDMKYPTINGKKKKLTMMQVRNYIVKPNPKDLENSKEMKENYEKDCATFGSSKYNRFNVYRNNFKQLEDLHLTGECWIKDDEEIVNDEYAKDELDLTSDDDIVEPIEPQPKKKFKFKIIEKVEPPKETFTIIKIKKKKSKSKFGQQCEKCGKNCFTQICAKCQLG